MRIPKHVDPAKLKQLQHPAPARPPPAAPPPAVPPAPRPADGFDGPAQTSGPTRVGSDVPARIRADGLTVLNTSPAQRLQVNGVGIDVHGASPEELQTIRTTLSRLPASHLRTIPRVVVADTIAHGSKRTGGATISQQSIDRYEAGGSRPVRWYQEQGWNNLPRLELSRESLSRPRVRQTGISPTVLHETGHHVDRAYRLSGGLSPADLGNVQYGGTNREAGTGGGVYERFADAYMRHYLGSLGSDRTASATVQRALAQIEQRAE